MNNNMMDMGSGNMMNPAMMNPAMMNPNMINPNMINPNMMNPNMMNPNMMNPNMMNPNGMMGGMNPMGQPMISPDSIKGTSIAQLRQKSQSVQPDYQEEQSRSTNSMHSLHSAEKDSDATIDNLVSDINTSFDDFSPSDEKEEEQENEDSDGTEYIGTVLKYLKEPLLLLILFIILSQEQIKNFIGRYVAQINPRDDGSVSFLGVVIYGTILVVLFMSIRKLIIK